MNEITPIEKKIGKGCLIFLLLLVIWFVWGEIYNRRAVRMGKEYISSILASPSQLKDDELDYGDFRKILGEVCRQPSSIDFAYFDFGLHAFVIRCDQQDYLAELRCTNNWWPSNKD